jgi:protein ImuB
MTTLWLYLHFPQLHLDSLMSQSAYRANQALLVVEPKRSEVMQCNEVALQKGINKGMSLGAAATLCPALNLQAYDEQIELDKRVEIADKLYGLTSDISFFSHSDLLLRVQNMIKLYGGLGPYWLAIQHQLNRLNIAYHYAVASTPLAARLLALEHWNWIGEDRNTIQTRLLKCKLQHSDLDKKAIQKLNKVGVRQVKQLIDIPLVDIAKRFSEDFAQYLGRLQGTLAHPVNFYHPAPNFKRYMELLYDISDTHVLVSPLCRLLQGAEQFLTLRDKLAMQLVVLLHQREHEAISVSVGSPQGEYRMEAWKQLIELQLENIDLQSPIFGLTLSIEQVHLRTPDTADLFNTQRGELTRLQLMAILQAKLGEHAVCHPVFENSHLPEQASCHLHLSATPESDYASHSMRPAFLLSEPTPLNCKVSIKLGPERIQAAWWQSQLVERDYFIAQNQQGQWLWVYRTPKQEWFLHGIFS